jgi:hypothetical protein
MTKRFNVKKITLALVVIAALFVSDWVIAYDHHDLDLPPLSACPICAASQVLSSADSFFHPLAFNPGPCVITSLIPFEVNYSHHSAYFTDLNYRAPPQQ